MKIIANNLLYRFETELFQNDGIYSRNVNLVLAFDEYIRHLSDADMGELLGSGDKSDMEAFRQMVSEGIDVWLDDCRVKTLCLR